MNMTKRKVELGIIFTYILIFIQVLFALTFLINFMTESYDDKKDMLYQVSYAYVYVSILILIRKLVTDNILISKYLTWIIRLEILKALSSLLVSANIYQAKILVSLFGLILLFLYIILIVNILNKQYDDKVEIKGLRPYVIALIFGFVITLIGGIYAEYNGGFEIYGILYMILAIPYFFIIGYFNKMKTEIERSELAGKGSTGG